MWLIFSFEAFPEPRIRESYAIAGELIGAKRQELEDGAAWKNSLDSQGLYMPHVPTVGKVDDDGLHLVRAGVER